MVNLSNRYWIRWEIKHLVRLQDLERAAACYCQLNSKHPASYTSWKTVLSMTKSKNFKKRGTKLVRFAVGRSNVGQLGVRLLLPKANVLQQPSSRKYPPSVKLHSQFHSSTKNTLLSSVSTALEVLVPTETYLRL